MTVFETFSEFSNLKIVGIPCIIIFTSFLLLRRYNLTEAEYDAIVEDLRNGVTRLSD